jgi:ABC-type Fe3+ transport system permease subunit
MQNNAAIAAASLLFGSAFFLTVSIVAVVRRCSIQGSQESVNASQINSKLKSVFSFLMITCAALLGCVPYVYIT